ncbi:LysE family translocator [Heliophilum fasciatum]|uniref:Threonine/homoserine/homoserine lactone efflux protein n=1 Tax=Heliophilum fasciatum TaxID=35700 RepID=A0A4R2RX40_9FIRM|nr:LysE family translocator [Heliophilum fasciatum]MCW2277869.1 threonine/homoserine/homoserine lactone efflux protein [Heliophilum fasciatum]TCP64561.1 threonine/homoserine/homoserine lactone efflux protein [Heliophilum fasciatum]
MELTSILSFLAVSVMLTLMPGPDIIFVVTQSIAQGYRAGIATALGLCTGLTVHTLAAALGVAALIYQSAMAFQVVKYAGALYLVYLAWLALKDKDTIALGKEETHTLQALYQRGILMNILNPKVSLFFLAFLPQFVSTERGSVSLQMVMLGFLFMVQAIIVFSLVSLFAGKLGDKLVRSPGIGRYINWAKAGIFALLGIRLAFYE